MSALPITALAPMMRDFDVAVRDQAWKLTPVGREAVRYLRHVRWSSASPNTPRAAEDVLSALAAYHADFPSLERFADDDGTEYLRAFLDSKWGGAAPATKAQRTSILRGFFRWATAEHRISRNPAETLRSPRVSSRSERQAYDMTVLHQLVVAQDSLRDQCALKLMCLRGLRRGELRTVRIRDIDLIRGYVLVHGKGAKTDLLPLGSKSLREDLGFHIAAEERRPLEYLLYPRSERTSPMDPASVHRWFKRCVKRAGLPETMTPHELRHSAADALWHETGNVALAQQLLRHEHVATTERYLHPTKADLALGLDRLDELWARG